MAKSGSTALTVYRAVHRFARIAPTKAYHVMDLIRNQVASAGLDALRYQPHRAARMIEKVLLSAIANAEDRGVRNPENLLIVEAKVDGGPMFKRIQPHSRGQGFVIRKRFSHFTVGVASIEDSLRSATEAAAPANS